MAGERTDATIKRSVRAKNNILRISCENQRSTQRSRFFQCSDISIKVKAAIPCCLLPVYGGPG